MLTKLLSDTRSKRARAVWRNLIWPNGPLSVIQGYNESIYVSEGDAYMHQKGSCCQHLKGRLLQHRSI